MIKGCRLQFEDAQIWGWVERDRKGVEFKVFGLDISLHSENKSFKGEGRSIPSDRFDKRFKV